MLVLYILSKYTVQFYKQDIYSCSENNSHIRYKETTDNITNIHSKSGIKVESIKGSAFTSISGTIICM